MVNVVPRELQGQKCEGPQAPMVFGLGTSRGTTFTMLPQRLFSKNTILYNSRASKLDSLPANVAPRDYPSEYTPSAFTNIDVVKSNIVRGNYKEWTTVFCIDSDNQNRAQGLCYVFL